jgi:hypothetical protein
LDTLVDLSSKIPVIFGGDDAVDALGDLTGLVLGSRTALDPADLPSWPFTGDRRSG